MYNNLYKLFSRKDESELQSRSLLEDFNTEAFVGLLKGNDSLKEKFIKQFLNLPEDNYEILTQVSKSLKKLNTGDSDCRIDIILEGKGNVVFIECKVNSTEGFEQLNRYQKALGLHYPYHNKVLLYITKNYDPKTFIDCNFKQYRWFEIARFLNEVEEKTYYKTEYLSFLKNQGMAQEYVMTKENFEALKVLQKTVEIAQTYIENSKKDFECLFGIKSVNSNWNWGEIQRSNRFCNLSQNILDGEGYSEIVYSIEFDTSELSAHIFVDKNHELFNDFKALKTLPTMEFIEFSDDRGASFYIKESLERFIDNEDSLSLVANWYSDTFRTFKCFIDTNKNVFK